MAFQTFDPSSGREYPGFTLYPFFHRSGPMPWAAAAVLEIGKLDKLVLLSGQTGRDPETDRRPRNREEEEAGVGQVVGPGIGEQTTASWQRIQETLDGLGMRLEDIVFIRYFLVDREDYWGMWQATQAFFAQHAPDLIKNPRAATLLRQVELALPTMRVEIEVMAAKAKA